MQLFSLISSSLFLAAAVQAAQTSDQGMVKVHVVQVGQNGSLTFSPDNLQVNPGEMVQFQFWPKNHSVVQSSFESPCTPIDTVQPNVTGFKSGFMPVSASATTIPVFTLMVNNTEPIWVHCSQTGHCQKGMVMAINAPTSGNKTFAAYKALAMQQSSSSTTSTSSGGSSNSTSGTGTSGSSSSASSGSASSGSISSGSSSGSSSTSSSTSTTSAPATVNAGAKPIVNAAILMALSVFGFVFVAL
ncbi:hypothetical protein VTN77DRAFT_3250 [Rasamsonia byssochlamydoides]|uniref:uncharacterized protein n=1 Tax=Rasamsonia byssochlamydoides TaxID=89139 RepID=UPI003742DF49